jgi:PucR C-terminal helix-turn-helix domain
MGKVPTTDDSPLELSTGDQEERSALTALATALLERLDELTARCIDRFHQDSDAYRDIPVAELRSATATGIRAGLASVTQLTGPGEEAASYAARIGELRARQGVPVEAVMQSFQVAAQVILGAWDQEAARLRVPTELVLRVHDLSWAWANFVMTHAARAHGRADLELAQHGAERRAELVRDLLFGRLDDDQLDHACAAHGLRPTGHYIAFRASLGGATDISELNRALQKATETAHPLTAIIDGDLAGLLTRAPDLDSGHIVALGPAAVLAEISDSFAIASENLKAAEAFGRVGVHTPDGLGLLPAVLMASDLGSRLDGEHFSALDHLGQFGDQLEETVSAYLASQRNIGATAHKLGVHPNSIRHRLDRFQQTTRLDLRDTDKLVIAWWILKRREMIPTSPRAIDDDGATHNPVRLGGGDVAAQSVPGDLDEVLNDRRAGDVGAG